MVEGGGGESNRGTPRTWRQEMLDYRIVDIDNHFYEPRDSFTRYLDKASHDRAVRAESLDDGREVFLAADREVTFIESRIYD